MAIRLIAGLGNPGRNYARTRHNIGAAWLDRLAERFGIRLVAEKRFKCLLGRGDMLGRDVRLALPTTYMNLSGDAIGPLARFYKLAADDVLVAYDEVAFPVGVARLKSGGGHNGHNGLKSIISALGNERGFARLRIGVGHPGDPARMVAFLTGTAMPPDERASALDAATISDDALDSVLDGDFDKAMNLFHAPKAP